MFFAFRIEWRMFFALRIQEWTELTSCFVSSLYMVQHVTVQILVLWRVVKYFILAHTETAVVTQNRARI